MSCCVEGSDSDEEERSEYRECTDVLWLCIFALFWILMIFVAVFAYAYGNPLKLINGSDTFGNICGSENNEKLSEFNLSGITMAKKKYLFYMDFRDTSLSLKICVERCPDTNMASLADIKDFYRRTGSSLCRYDLNLEYVHENASLHTPIGPCPVLPMNKSVPIINRCVPDTYVLNHLATQNWNLIEEILRDLFKNWHWILAFTIFAFALSVILISLMYVFASTISWIIMIAVSFISIAGTTLLWWTYFEIKCKLDSDGQELLDEEINNEEAFIWYSVIATLFTLIVLLLMYTFRKHVSFVVTLFQESSNCLSELPILYFQPLITFLLLFAFYTFWISVVVCLATASYPESKERNLFWVNSSSAVPPSNYHMEELQSYPESKENNSFWVKNSLPEEPLHYHVEELRSYTKVDYIEISWLQYMIFLYGFGLIWVSEFILSCQHMIVAGSVAQWYFSRNSRNATSVVFSSMGNLICYHIGSLALGSLLITLLKVPRLVLSYVYKRIRKHENSECTDYVATCCSCCFCCLEKFLRYMNHNAYTIVALEGYNFCPAAYRAWKILVANALKLATINSVGDFILFLAKCLVTLICTGTALAIFTFDSNLHLFAASTLVVCVFAYFVAHSVISLYETVIDTLFLCICHDHQVNGSDGQWKSTAFATITYRGIKTCSSSPPIELQRTA